MTHSYLPTVSTQALEQAAQWWVQLNEAEPPPEQQQQWQAWLTAAVEHQIAWDKVNQINYAFSACSTEQLQQTLRLPNLKRRLLLSSIAGAGLTAGLLSWAYKWNLHAAWLYDAHTHKGEQRTWHLVDGSELRLNTDSAVNIDYNATERRLWLKYGEIYVRTAHDALERPFWVHTLQAQIQALGTAFTVHQQRDQLSIAVQADRVAVWPSGANSASVVVEAGQAFTLRAGQNTPIAHQNLVTSGWLENRLEADNIRLDVLLQELQRYRPGYIFCSPEAAVLRVSGSFQLSEPEQILQNLQLSLHLAFNYYSPYLLHIDTIK